MNIHPSWKPVFDNYNFDIDKIYEEGNVYPKKEHLFRVFEMDVMDITIVLLGQDPYHRINQANGLSFSVSDGIKIPPSLRNIFKEIKNDFPERNYNFASGNLEQWFNREKIFLLNSSLSVMEGKPSSHMDIWIEFTNDVIHYISSKNKKCVFLLLGNYAKNKEKFIENKSMIVTGPHPSPLARGFINSKIFIKVENILDKKINWEIL